MLGRSRPRGGRRRCIEATGAAHRRHESLSAAGAHQHSGPGGYFRRSGLAAAGNASAYGLMRRRATRPKLIIQRMAQSSPLMASSLDATTVLPNLFHWHNHLETFDVVVSTCLLSQLIRQVGDAFRDDTRVAPYLACAMVNAHLECIIGLTKPSGTALLICDIASSSKNLPDLMSSRATAALNELAQQLQSGNRQYSYLSPRELVSVLAGPATAPFIASVIVIPYWLWQFSDNKRYLCHACGSNAPVSPCDASTLPKPDWRRDSRVSPKRMAFRLQRCPREICTVRSESAHGQTPAPDKPAVKRQFLATCFHSCTFPPGQEFSLNLCHLFC